jgi:uncharacterized protein (TIGR02246 family)
MNRKWILYLSGLSLTAGLLCGQGSDDAAVRAVVAQYMEARGRMDAKALEPLFTSDADQLVSSGEWRRGRASVVQGGLASSRATGGTRAIHVESVRFPTPDVAIADGRYELTGTAAGSARRMWTTFVMVRGASGWKIAAIRNMLPAAPAR